MLPDLLPLHRFPTAPQLLTKLVTGQIPCGAFMVPTSMFMGQVVTAFAPQQGQTQTISISQEQQQVQSQVSTLQAGHSPLALQQPQFLQVYTATPLELLLASYLIKMQTKPLFATLP